VPVQNGGGGSALSPQSQKTFDNFLNALYNDIRSQINYFNITAIPTVYIGGGTPSLFGGSRIAELLSFIKAQSKNNIEEITVEANSESLDGEFIDACMSGGVTRLSIGIQTFNDASRAIIGRIGSAELIKNNLTMLKHLEKHIDISFDLISGLPLQDKNILLNDIETALAYKPCHISLYDLSIEPGTPLAASINTIPMPSVEFAEELYLAGRDFLEQNGFSQYEVSNFAKDGRRSLHNIRYWTMQNWLGCGPGASGTVIDDSTGTAFRRTIFNDVDSYIKYFTNKNTFDACPGMNIEIIDKKTLLKESLMMGFRYIDGPNEPLFKKRFSVTIDDAIPETIFAWREKGLYDKTKTALTKDGLLLLNRFLRDCFDEIDKSKNISPAPV
jgi:oxygen-independent coproporphyrinogen-3 oxidase